MPNYMLIFSFVIFTSTLEAASFEFQKCMDEVDYSAMKNTQMNACIDAEYLRVLNATSKRYPLDLKAKDTSLAADVCEAKDHSREAPNPYFSKISCRIELLKDLYSIYQR